MSSKTCVFITTSSVKYSIDQSLFYRVDQIAGQLSPTRSCSLSYGENGHAWML